MKSANPLNAPLIPRLFSLTFCRCVCWRRTPAAADSFIVLLCRLHLKSIRTNGRVFECQRSFITSQPATCQSHGPHHVTCRRRRVRLQKSGTAAPGPETSPEPGPGPAEATRPADSRTFLLFDSPVCVSDVSGVLNVFSVSYFDRYAVCTLSHHLGPCGHCSVRPGCFLSGRQRPGAVPKPGPGPGAASPPAAAKSSECRSPVTGERFKNQSELYWPQTPEQIKPMKYNTKILLPQVSS